MDTAPETKLRSIQRLGATIVQAPVRGVLAYGRTHRSDRMRGHFVHPFDDDLFISGNGTIGLELVEDLPDVDAVVAPIGGGGLLAGIAAALAELRPEATIYAAEPETAAPLALSLERRAGEPLRRRGPRRSSTAPAAVGAAVDVAAASSPGRRIARRLARRRGGGDAGRPIASTSLEGAAACAIAAAATSPELAARGHRRWSRSSRAATSELASDLWWTWNREAREVFRRLDYRSGGRRRTTRC
jgi:cysteine synthase